jgi:hypothetical protein
LHKQWGFDLGFSHPDGFLPTKAAFMTHCERNPTLQNTQFFTQNQDPICINGIKNLLDSRFFLPFWPYSHGRLPV